MKLTWKIYLFITLVNTPIMRLLPCLHYMSPTFCGQNFCIISISPKMVSTHLYCQHHLKSKKFCQRRYFLMYFVDVCGGKNHLEKF